MCRDPPSRQNQAFRPRTKLSEPHNTCFVSTTLPTPAHAGGLESSCSDGSARGGNSPPITLRGLVGGLEVGGSPPTRLSALRGEHVEFRLAGLRLDCRGGEGWIYALRYLSDVFAFISLSPFLLRSVLLANSPFPFPFSFPFALNSLLCRATLPFASTGIHFARTSEFWNCDLRLETTQSGWLLLRMQRRGMCGSRYVLLPCPALPCSV